MYTPSQCSIHTYLDSTLFSNAHLHDEYFCQVLLKSCHYIQRCVNGRQRIDGPQTTDTLMARWVTTKQNAFTAYCWDGRQQKIF